MNTHSLVSIEDYTKEEILEVLESASEFEKNPNQRLLEGKVVASLFSNHRPVPVLALKRQSIVWADVSSVFLMRLLPA